MVSCVLVALLAVILQITQRDKEIAALMALLQRKVAVEAAQQRNSSAAASNGAGTALQPPAATVAATAATAVAAAAAATAATAAAATAAAATAATAVAAAATATQERPLGAAQTLNYTEQLSSLDSSSGEMGSAVLESGPRRPLERASAEALPAETHRVRCQLFARDARGLYSILGRQNHDWIGFKMVLFQTFLGHVTYFSTELDLPWFSSRHS